ncbi:unnamed protein product [Anisakis simplex]|uniref:GMPS ATP-PPase domain-containing protein n=1 Tax=Anisakis simplex TaxID=6269 RepID=A0A0M3K4Z2_ANISI|nr:unnamed protein product [Anisakis simplex]
MHLCVMEKNKLSANFQLSPPILPSTVISPSAPNQSTRHPDYSQSDRTPDQKLFGAAVSGDLSDECLVNGLYISTESKHTTGSSVSSATSLGLLPSDNINNNNNSNNNLNNPNTLSPINKSATLESTVSKSNSTTTKPTQQHHSNTPKKHSAILRPFLRKKTKRSTSRGDSSGVLSSSGSVVVSKGDDQHNPVDTKDSDSKLASSNKLNEVMKRSASPLTQPEGITLPKNDLRHSSNAIHSPNNVTIADESRKLYGVQFHPEVDLTLNGREMFESFLFGIAGCNADFTMGNREQLCIDEIKSVVKDKKVLVMVSGGVDSTVCAALMRKALGPEKVIAIHIDNGFMRYNESNRVIDALNKINLNVKRYNAYYSFINGSVTINGKKSESLLRVTQPELKRKIIGDTFMKVKDMIMDEVCFY